MYSKKLIVFKCLALIAIFFVPLQVAFGSSNKLSKSRIEEIELQLSNRSLIEVLSKAKHSRMLGMLYESEQWESLSDALLEHGLDLDVSFLYLGRMSLEVGHNELGLRLLKKAITYPKKHFCLIADLCHVINVRDEALVRLAKRGESVPITQNDRGPSNDSVEGRETQGHRNPLVSLLVTTSKPDSDGAVIISVDTKVETRSLKINGDELGGRVDGQYSVRRFAQVGESLFDVVATDRHGNIQRKTVSVSREFTDTAPTIRALDPLALRVTKPRDAVAIVIGIEKYRSVPAADFANRDASIFLDYARRALGVPSENIRLLLDEKADSIEMLRTFRNWLPTRINKGKTDVYVFFSGHGLPAADGRSLYFLPHEVDKDLLDRTAVTQKEVVDAIQRTSPKSVTMFIDSCYSGQSRTGETLLASARPISIVAKETSSFPPNFTVISASAPDQISSSSPDLKHGIFSYYLMRGMEGEADGNRDGQITVGEMQAYLSDRVPRRAMGMNRTQQPQVVGDQSRILVAR